MLAQTSWGGSSFALLTSFVSSPKSITLAPTSTWPRLTMLRWWPLLLFSHPKQPLLLNISNGLIVLVDVLVLVLLLTASRSRVQILPSTHEIIARTVRTDMTAKKGPIDPEELPATLVEEAPEFAATGCCCCCWGNNEAVEAIYVMKIMNVVDEDIARKEPTKMSGGQQGNG